jgi:hypothetical protein
MMHYKAPDNSLHCIDEEFCYLLPIGSVPVSDSEALALSLNQPSSNSIKAQIYQLELLLTQRRFREAILTGDNSYIQNINSQIAALRTKLG